MQFSICIYHIDLIFKCCVRKVHGSFHFLFTEYMGQIIQTIQIWRGFPSEIKIVNFYRNADFRKRSNCLPKGFRIGVMNILG